MNLKTQITSGLSWNFKNQISIQAINFVVGIILMRLLVPDDFGKFAMVFIIISFLKIFSDLGLSAAIIQRQDIDERYLSSAFWFQLMIALIVSTSFIFFGGFFNNFYGEEVLDQISFWLGIDFFIGTLSIIPFALLQKELNFKALFKINLTAVGISSVVGICMAMNDMSIFSLVVKMLIWTTVSSLGAFWVIKWRPIFIFSSESLKTLLKFGIPAAGNHILSYLVRNSDDFFIGRVIGASALGLYNRAYMLMMLPMGNITSVISNVLFPSWSKMRDDIPEVKRLYIKVSGIIAFVSFPLMMLLAFLAAPIVLLLFGEKWVSMSTVLSILSTIGMLQSVGSLVGMIYMVFDKNALLFKINLIISGTMIFVIIASVYLFKSIVVTALSYAVISLFAGFPSLHYAGKIINATFFELTKPLIRPLVISLFISLLGWTLFQTIPIDILFIKLSFSGIFALTIYFLLSLKFNTQVVNDLSSIIRQYKSSINE